MCHLMLFLFIPNIPGFFSYSFLKPGFQFFVSGKLPSESISIFYCLS